MKFILKLILILSILLAFIVGFAIEARNFIFKVLLTEVLERITGLGLHIREFQIEFNPPLAKMKDVTLLNPPNFPEPVMMNFPELYVEYDTATLFKFKPRIKVMKIYLKELDVIKNTDGVLNLESFNVFKKKQPAAVTTKKNKEAKIETLKLKIDEVYISDYSHEPKGHYQRYRVNIDESYENVTDFKVLSKLIMVKALTNDTVANLQDIANLDMTGIKKDVDLALKGGLKLVTGVIKGTVNVITSPFKGTPATENKE